LPGISQFYTVTTILKRISNGQERGCATGFFFNHNENLYIVTNKHVIYGNNFGQNDIFPTPEIDSLKLNLHTDRSNTTRNEEVTIRLFEGNNKLWLEHHYTDVDVVLIPLTIDPSRYTFSKTDRTLIDCENLVVDDFERIFVIGYP
jgi:hypothetical protein